MRCPNCEIVRNENPNYRMHDPKCIYCGARLIINIGKLRISREEASTRRTAMLKVWVDYGHSEMEIRRLVKMGIGLANTSASDRPSNGKRPSHGKKSKRG